MKNSIEYGRIKFVSFYTDAPSSAKYILRKLEGG